MTILGWVGVSLITIFIAICFGRIAAKHGKNPILYGVLSVISAINLIILGVWAFSKSGASREQEISHG